MRDATGRWLKGAPSPNPSGRPREVAEVRELARGYTAEAIEALVAIMRDPDAPAAARASAASAVLDRGHGRPHTTSDVRLENVDVASQHVEAIRAMAARRKAAKEGEGDEPTGSTSTH